MSSYRRLVSAASRCSPIEVGAAPIVDQLPRLPLHVEVADRLRDMIITARLKPGERINESHLSDYLGVSRTPLREALKALQSEGLIVHFPNRGTHVSHVTRDHAVELFEALACIERFCGEATARLVDDAQLDQLEALHREMFDCHGRGERESYFALNCRIHRAFVEICGNALLAEIHAKLMIGAERLRVMAVQVTERWDESVAEHRAILAAIEKHDAGTAGALIEQHVRQTGVFICDNLDRLMPPMRPRRRRANAGPRNARSY